MVPWNNNFLFWHYCLFTPGQKSSSSYDPLETILCFPEFQVCFSFLYFFLRVSDFHQKIKSFHIVEMSIGTQWQMTRVEEEKKKIKMTNIKGFVLCNLVIMRCFPLYLPPLGAKTFLKNESWSVSFVIPGHYRFSSTEVLDSGNHQPCDKFHCIEGVSFSSLFILYPYSFDTSKGVEGGKYSDVLFIIDVSHFWFIMNR